MPPLNRTTGVFRTAANSSQGERIRLEPLTFDHDLLTAAARYREMLETEEDVRPTPDIKKELKKRHLNQSERRKYHKPNPDWEQTPSGEVCKSACTLVVDDLIAPA
jgi:hypothetical protein